LHYFQKTSVVRVLVA